jgi:hypothetical protein
MYLQSVYVHVSTKCVCTCIYKVCMYVYLQSVYVRVSTKCVCTCIYKVCMYMYLQSVYVHVSTKCVCTVHVSTKLLFLNLTLEQAMKIQGGGVEV